MVWVPEHVGLDGEIVDQLARQGCSTPTSRTQACSWHICKGYQGSDQGLDKHKIRGVLAVH
jgi:hypothetical protein